MKLLLGSLLLGCLLSMTVWAETVAPALDAGLTHLGYHEQPEWFKASFLDLRDDIAEASKAGKRVMLYFYQDGCPYCAKLLKENFGNDAIASQVRQQFDVIAINLWGDRTVTDLDGKETTEKAFAASLKVQYTPTLVFLDETGKVALRTNGYYAPDKFRLALDYAANHQEKTGSFREFMAKQAIQPPAKAAADTMPELAEALPHPLHLQDARRGSGRPLMVLFVQNDCLSCQELVETILGRTEVVYALSNLDVAQVDVEDTTVLQTPAGKDMKASEWARELEVKYTPSLVFFDTDGKEVFRTEAYLRAFHLHGAMDYVISGAYRWQPEFQRFLQHRTDTVRARGIKVDLMQ